MNIAGKKEEVSIRELEAIVAAEAMQVPPAYMVTNYVINTGNITGAMAHMRMKFHERDMDGISTGDGPIDAAFMAIEQAIGKHFELDEFRIQAITEGQEAMGETLVKLRSNGKLYPGRGISTDIVGSSIMAYINALNKIVYEEEEA
jgi:2-isopropylmalate synthase